MSVAAALAAAAFLGQPAGLAALPAGRRCWRAPARSSGSRARRSCRTWCRRESVRAAISTSLRHLPADDGRRSRPRRPADRASSAWARPTRSTRSSCLGMVVARGADVAPAARRVWRSTSRCCARSPPGLRFVRGERALVGELRHRPAGDDLRHAARAVPGAVAHASSTRAPPARARSTPRSPPAPPSPRSPPAGSPARATSAASPWGRWPSGGWRSRCAGLSSTLWAAALLFAVAGAADSVSAVCRSTISQTLTPDHDARADVVGVHARGRAAARASATSSPAPSRRSPRRASRSCPAAWPASPGSAVIVMAFPAARGLRRRRRVSGSGRAQLGLAS